MIVVVMVMITTKKSEMMKIGIVIILNIKLSMNAMIKSVCGWRWCYSQALVYNSLTLTLLKKSVTNRS